MPSGRYDHAPVLSTYKYGFVARRLVQTLTGGLSIPEWSPSTRGTAMVLIALQTVIWILPGLVGTLFYYLIVYKKLTSWLGCSIFAGFSAVFCSFLKTIRWLKGTRTSSSVDQAESNTSEDQSDNGRSRDRWVVTYFLPPPQKNPLIVISTILLAAAHSGGALFFLLGTSEMDFDRTTSLCIVTFGWVSFCVTSYSFAIKSPPELADLSAEGRSIFHRLSRIAYSSLVIISGIILRLVISSAESRLVVLVMFGLLPILHIFGVLPIVDTFAFWLGENALLNLFGGTSADSWTTLILQLSASLIASTVLFFCPNLTYLIVLGAVFGFLNSLDLSQVLSIVLRRFAPASCGETARRLGVEREDASGAWSTDFHLSVSLTLTAPLAIAVGLLVVCYAPANSASSHLALSISLTTFIVVLLLFDNVFTATLLCGCLKNPLYAVIMRNRQSSSTLQWTLHNFVLFRNVIVSMVVSALYGNSSAAARLRLRNPINRASIVVVHFMCWSHSAHVWLADSGTADLVVMPLICVATVTLLATERQPGGGFFAAVATSFCFRTSWQRPVLLSILLAFYGYLRRFCPSVDITFSPIDHHVRILALAYIVHALVSFVGKLWIYLVLVVSRSSYNQLHRGLLVALVAWNALLWPVHVGVIAAASLLSLTIVPLFTLPVLVLGPSRPILFWPRCRKALTSPSPDWALYKSSEREVLWNFCAALYQGRLGFLCPGGMYLTRFQTRTFIFQVAGYGFGYLRILLKGLELEETSCHAREAYTIDETLDKMVLSNDNVYRVLHPSSLRCRGCIKATIYSETRNTLTGIVGSRTFMSIMADIFKKAVVRSTVRSIIAERSNSDLLPSNMGQSQECFSVSAPVGLVPDIVCHTDLQLPAVTDIKADDDAGSGSFSSWKDTDDDLDLNSFGFHAMQVRSSPPRGLDSVDIQVVSTTHASLFASDCANTDSPLELSRRKTGGSSTSLVSAGFTQTAKTGPFPEQFLTLCLSYFCNTDTARPQLGYDTVLARCQHMIDKSSLALLDNVNKNDIFTSCSNSYLVDLFSSRGYFESSPTWLAMAFEQQETLISCFRMAFKLAIDQQAFDEVKTDEDLLRAFDELENCWHLGPDNKENWKLAVLQLKPKLMSVTKDSTGTVISSRVLSLEDVQLPVAELSLDAACGLWSSMAMELLYATNDDEERYSIQAHSTMFRNILMQSADTPLGYPLYSSGVLHVS